ncbi:MAG TPA: dicarboxylate/amino acid:cation symporter [Candidatus Anaerobiospirillum pullistercoris]|uniref:Dicarboxylate/amino acid:cation symporter n=1 Tax=Candidatus Anaerobiospirillum pullistercoris TaxID=2838452 RepID=A0A9D1WEM7_9GAMM|nr:dicarboxylate/amino acid:cation symporter [Candidatus Anaerobiospirillum pullistercoris]
MTTNTPSAGNVDSMEAARSTIANLPKKRRLITAGFYIVCLVLGLIIGYANNPGLNELMTFIATVFTRLFSFIAVPIIALALISTLAKLGKDSSSGQIFGHTVFYTLSTTIVAAVVGAILFWVLQPANVPAEVAGMSTTEPVQPTSYYDHILSVIPNNILQPFVSGNVLSVLLIAAAVGMALAVMPHNERRTAVLNTLVGLQDVLFVLIRWILVILPIGIMGFTAQLVAQLGEGVILGSLATYFTVVIGSNLLQMFVIIPLFLIARGLNPLRIFRGMLPALAVAFFSKSSAGTLPVTMASAENNCHVNPKISRFVLPICTTINMNGCAAFILITSLYLMQNAGIEITLTTTIVWIFVATIAAVGNAGVPMGCYFLTISLLSSMHIPVILMGVILPVYAVIDMIETGVNVWSDSAVANMVNKDLSHEINELEQKEHEAQVAAVAALGAESLVQEAGNANRNA